MPTLIPVVMGQVGPPPYPGDNVRVPSPNPSPVSSPEALPGPRIRIGQTDDIEALINGRTFSAGTVIELERGATWTDKRLIIDGDGDPSMPVLVCAVGVGADPTITA